MIESYQANDKPASGRKLPSIQEQRQFWNWHWRNAVQRKALNDWTERRSREVLQLIHGLPLKRPKILDFGCGNGWFSERLADFGEVHAIDLSPEGISAAKARRPDIHFMAGNIYEAPLPVHAFDILISQEVIAHVESQPKYLARAAEVLKPGGYLVLTTSNKFVWDRLGDVGWNVQPPEHIANQLSRKQLREMLAPNYRVLKLLTIIPHGSRGLLRIVNSYKLNSMLRVFTTQEKIDRLKERAGLGWQMIILAQKKN